MLQLENPFPKPNSKLLLKFVTSMLVVMGAMVLGSYGSMSQAASSPLAGAALYRDPRSPAATQAAQWRASRPADAAHMDRLAAQPMALWVGDWTPNIQTAAADYTSRAANAGGVGVIVAYNIPARDCGGYSAGGSASHANYRAWIDGLAAGIGARKTVVILEPDAVAGIDCLDGAGRQARYESLSYAISRLKAGSAAVVYLDAGNSGWHPAAEVAARLLQAGGAAADGFSLNVSNFFTTAQSTSYGNDISGRTGGKHFVIDTSRNGLGANGEWCNPSGRALGNAPTVNAGAALVDAYLWIKIPGESDGACNGGPAAGTWWAEYALGLAQRAPGVAAVPAAPAAGAARTPKPARVAAAPSPTPTATPTPTPQVLEATASPTPAPVATAATKPVDSTRLAVIVGIVLFVLSLGAFLAWHYRSRFLHRRS